MTLEFQKDFLWASASAAYQVEGAWNTDGKGQSIWDQFSKKQGKTFKGSNGDIAVDHYHRYIEDVNLMKELGLKAYRFSISWPRILPNGRGQINQAGIDFYHNLINELKKNNIEPIVTIYHWDLPLSLQDEYRGWENRKIIDDFVAYSELLFREYGNKVKYWVTINEQNYFTHNGYITSRHPPEMRDEKAFYQVNHHAFVANALTIKSFRKIVPHGQIGPSFAYSPAYPKTSHPKDIKACDFAEDFTNYWWLDAYLVGRYPETVSQYLKQDQKYPKIHQNDFELLQKYKPDFLGINYYQTLTYTSNEENIFVGDYNTTGSKGSTASSGQPGYFKTTKNENLPQTNWDWNIDADGLAIGLRRLYSRYKIPMLITENGLGEFDKLENEKVHDSYRIDYLNKHFLAAKEAIDDGVELLGFCTWSFTDLLSWLNGYQKRYGLVYIDRDEINEKELKRYKKDSFYWYQEVIAQNGSNLKK